MSTTSFTMLDDLAGRQSAEEQAARALAGARARMILGRDAKSAFFATLALRLTPIPDWELETLATDGRSLRYHPPFVNGLCPDELVGVLAHECMHNALAHPMRQGSRDQANWNIACDLAINPLLLQAGIILPAGRLMPGEGRFTHLDLGKSAEEYYAALSDPQANGDDSNDPGRCGGIEPTPSDVQATEAEWRIAVVQAEQAAATRGELPDGLRRTVAEAHLPSVDWRCVLREFVATTARNDFSWTRPNRRFVAQGLYLPGLRSEELGQVCIAIDTSGSIDQAMLGTFASEVNAVLASYDCTVTIAYHDTQVQQSQTWSTTDGPLTLDPVGGGGTSHVSLFEWSETSGLDTACIICLTDLETVFPQTAPNAPVLWAKVGSSSTVPPFGQVVAIGR